MAELLTPRPPKKPPARPRKLGNAPGIILITDEALLNVPTWVKTLNAFRAWSDEPAFPEKGNIWWLRGGVWADMSKEQVFTHVLVKTKCTTTLDFLSTADNLGLVLADGVRVTNLEIGFSGKPDLTFISHRSRRLGLVRFLEGRERGYTEVIGSPDMLMEVISDSSEEKDLQTLFVDYFAAGVQEYWLVDVRGDEVRFDIYRRGKSEFLPIRKQGGWLKSSVFGKSFRLIREEDEFGAPTFRLEVK